MTEEKRDLAQLVHIVTIIGAYSLSITTLHEVAFFYGMGAPLSTVFIDAGALFSQALSWVPAYFTAYLAILALVTSFGPSPGSSLSLNLGWTKRAVAAFVLLSIAIVATFGELFVGFLSIALYLVLLVAFFTISNVYVAMRNYMNHFQIATFVAIGSATIGFYQGMVLYIIPSFNDRIVFQDGSVETDVDIIRGYGAGFLYFWIGDPRLRFVSASDISTISIDLDRSRLWDGFACRIVEVGFCRYYHEDNWPSQVRRALEKNDDENKSATHPSKGDATNPGN